MGMKELVKKIKTFPFEGDSHSANSYRSWETFSAIAKNCGVEVPTLGIVPLEGDTIRVNCTLIEGALLFVEVTNSQYGGVIASVEKLVYHDQSVQLGDYPE